MRITRMQPSNSTLVHARKGDRTLCGRTAPDRYSRTLWFWRGDNEHVTCGKCAAAMNRLGLNPTPYQAHAEPEPTHVPVPFHLTAENGAKAVLSGEFSFQRKLGVGPDGNDVVTRVDVPWTTIKEIHAAIVAAVRNGRIR